MKKVKIFVAGAKALSKERNGLKALAQELNTRYNDQEVDVFVEMKSYEEFKDNQNEYEAYIRKSADMALFILDGQIGGYTKREFVTAVDAYKQKQIPEIVVFLKNYHEETDEIREILNLLKLQMGDNYFYVGYDDVDELKSKAEKRISRFITPTDHTRSMKRWRMIALVFATVMLIGLCLLLVNNSTLSSKNYHWKQNEPMLLFLGGGSVANFLASEDSVDLDSLVDIPNAIYMGVPTGDLWNMLGEEYYKCTDLESQKFFPVFLAASSIDIETTKKAIGPNSSLKENILIFQLYIGNDTIRTFVEQNWFDTHVLKKDGSTDGHFLTEGAKYKCQDSIQLRNLILAALDPCVLYTTSPNSGTLKAYHEVVKHLINLKDIVSDTKKQHKVFNEQTVLGDNNSFVVLGSDHYYPKDMRPKSYQEICLQNSKGEIVYKELYIYFVGYKDKSSGSNGKYRIPRPVAKFLEKLNVENKCWTYIDNSDGFITINLHEKQYPNDGIVRLKVSPRR